jgi:hypothetical protein
MNELMLSGPHGVRMTSWNPVVYRGDGAWIGIMPDGLIGVGVESEGRASLVGSGFVPMWPYLESGFSSALAALSDRWPDLGGGGIPTPERLIELTVESAWKSGRSYWMQLAAPWAIDMSRRDGFRRGVVLELLREMAGSEILSPAVRDEAGRALLRVSAEEGSE